MFGFKKLSLMFLVGMLFFSVAVSVENSLWLRNPRTYPSTIEPGETNVTLIFEVKHYGTVTYENITLAFESTEYFSFPEKVSIVKIDPKSAETIITNFNVSDEASPGTYAVPVKVSYDTIDGSTFYVRYLYLQVSRKPRLRISSISSSQAFIGEGFETEICLFNNGSLPSSEVNITLTPSTSSVYYVPSSVVLDSIKENSESCFVFNGFSSVHSEEQLVPVNVSVVSDSGEITSLFFVDLLGKPKLSLSGVSLSEKPLVGQQVSLSLLFENIGTGDVKAAKAVLNLGSLASGINESVIGSVEKDDSGTAVFELVFNKPGVIRIPVTVYYSDKKGDEFTYETYFSVFVKQTPPNYSLAGFFILLFVIFLVLFYFHSLKKRKRGRALNV